MIGSKKLGSKKWIVAKRPNKMDRFETNPTPSGTTNVQLSRILGKDMSRIKVVK